MKRNQPQVSEHCPQGNHIYSYAVWNEGEKRHHGSGGKTPGKRGYGDTVSNCSEQTVKNQNIGDCDCGGGTER